MTHRDDRGFLTPESVNDAMRELRVTLASFIDHLTTVWPNREMIHIHTDMSRAHLDTYLAITVFGMHRELELKARDKIIINRELTQTENFQTDSITVMLTGICIPPMLGREATTEPSIPERDNMVEHFRQQFDIPLYIFEELPTPARDAVRTRPGSSYPLDDLLGQIDALTEEERPRRRNG